MATSALAHIVIGVNGFELLEVPGKCTHPWIRGTPILPSCGPTDPYISFPGKRAESPDLIKSGAVRALRSCGWSHTYSLDFTLSVSVSLSRYTGSTDGIDKLLKLEHTKQIETICRL